MVYLTKMMEVLEDPEKRAIYDETGEINDDNISYNNDDLDSWRNMFKKVTGEDIKAYQVSFYFTNFL